MKVKTDFVPSEVDYIVAGKVYEVEVVEDGISFHIDCEYPDGEEVKPFCLFRGCAHLDGNDWEIVE